MRRYTWEGEARKERKENDTEVVHCLSKTQGQSWAGVWLSGEVLAWRAVRKGLGSTPWH